MADWDHLTDEEIRARMEEARRNMTPEESRKVVELWTAFQSGGPIPKNPNPGTWRRAGAHVDVKVTLPAYDELALTAVAQRNEIEHLRSLLKRCEWEGGGYEDGPFCPICNEYRPGPSGGGHTPDCELAAALGEEPKK